MGEYVKHRILGDNVKIGTCESLYYVTFPQFAKAAKAEHINAGAANTYMKPGAGFRFRFPFPDEKNYTFGSDGPDHNFDRGHLLKVPKRYGIEMGHETQFFRTDSNERACNAKAPAFGFSFPCLMGDNKEGQPAQVHDWDHCRDFSIFEVVAQKLVNDPEQTASPGRLELQTVIRCPYCGAMCRLSQLEAEGLARWALDQAAAGYPLSAFDSELIDTILLGYIIFADIDSRKITPAQVAIIRPAWDEMQNFISETDKYLAANYPVNPDPVNPDPAKAQNNG